MKRTDGIGPQFAQHAALGDGLERGSAQHAVDPLAEEVGEAKLVAHIHGQLLELPVVGVRHAGEAHAEPAQGEGKKRGEERGEDR